MSTLLVALVLVPLAQGGTAAPAGDPQAGKALWEGRDTSCKNCHGVRGEGGFGPDLAGRKLTFEQFKQAVRKPWGIMPAFIESQASDREMADFIAYFDSLPSVTQPGPWRFEVPAGAPRGQEIALATVGCGQCHTPTLDTPRHGAGAVNGDGDFEWFKRMVYDHTTAMPQKWSLLEERPGLRVRMGNYSRSRLPESLVQDIWTFMRDLGFLVPIRGRLSAGAAAANGVTYTLTVENPGLRGKGLTAEDLTITLILPAGAQVVSATGEGYQGVRPDERAKADAAVWRAPRIAPKDHQTYTITLSQAGTAADNVRGTLRWTTTPPPKTGPEAANIPPAPLPRQTQ